MNNKGSTALIIHFFVIFVINDNGILIYEILLDYTGIQPS